MIIEPDIKLDFKDVLIRPKRSTLTTRKEVDLNRKFSFVNAKLEIPYKGHELIPEYSGIPIMASNMDGVGTFDIADALIPHGMFTCLTKIYSEKELVDFFISESNKGGRTDYVAMSIGITEEDKNKFLRFSLYNGQVGKCSSDHKKRKKGEPYLERASIKQWSELEKKS